MEINGGKLEMFILGAGFSRAINKHMMLTSDLGQLIYDRLPTTLQDWMAEHRHFLPPSNFEEILSYVSQNQPWLKQEDNLRNQLVFVKMSTQIATAIDGNMTETFNPGREGLEWLDLLFAYWYYRKSYVITLNYDTLVERWDAHKGIGCEDIYPSTIIPIWQRLGGARLNSHRKKIYRLIKLHGSVNWLYSGQLSPGETIYYIPPDGAWTPEFSAVETKRYFASFADKIPLIVPPLMHKGPFFEHETIKSMWFEAGSALRYASEIYCLGYSMPETDLVMKFFLAANARKDTRINFHVVNRSKSSYERIGKLLGTSFNVIDECNGENSIQEFAERLRQKLLIEQGNSRG